MTALETVIKTSDDSKCLDSLFFQYINICGPEGSGKTLFLNALMEYYGIDSEKAQTLDLPGHGELYNLGGHPIIWLDFSDCRSESYEEALRFINHKMSDLYVTHKVFDHKFFSVDLLEDCLDIIEGICDEKVLSRSLLELVYLLYRQSYTRYPSGRPMIFIDEVTRPLLYASHHGFYDRLNSFFDTFLDIDHYELTGGIYTTSYSPVNTDVCYDLRYITDMPVNDIKPLAEFAAQKGFSLEKARRTKWLWNHEGYFENEMSLSECFNELCKIRDTRKPDPSPGDYPVPEVRAVIVEKRKWIREEKHRIREYELKEEKRIAKEYAAPLPEDCVIPSKFAGIRHLSIGVRDNERYEQLNRILKTLYVKHGKEISLRDVYDCIQGLDRAQMIRADIQTLLERLKTSANASRPVHRCSVNANDNYWGRFDLERFKAEPGYSDYALIKIYLTVINDSDVLPVFEDVIQFLITHGSHRCHAKISLSKRNDHICLWIAREDFFALEAHLEKYSSLFTEALPFVAYRNNIGISRELVSWDSHNGIQADLICVYLQNVSSADDVDVLHMYETYVKAWNGDLDSSHPFTRMYKSGNAQELLILLESIDVILGNNIISDDHLLLNGDAKLWHDLGASKNWFEVGEKGSCT